MRLRISTARVGITAENTAERAFSAVVSLLRLIYGTKAERGRIEVAKASFQRSFPELAIPNSLS
jgi:hypothetical protein